MWISMSPAANDASDYFDVGIKAISMFSMVYMIISIPMMFLATWLIEKYGLRFGVSIYIYIVHVKAVDGRMIPAI